MVARQRLEADSLNAVQKMQWEEGVRDLQTTAASTPAGSSPTCPLATLPLIEAVPMVLVSDDFEHIPPLF